MNAVLEFDRGTLVLRGLPRERESAGLPILWDERVGAHRARAMDYAALRRRLGCSGHTVEDRVRPRDPPPATWGPVELRPYQDAARDAWELAGGRGVVVLPTGSGKTHLAVAVMARSGVRSLCLVPTRALLEQWVRLVSRVYRGTTGCLGDGERRVECGPLRRSDRRPDVRRLSLAGVRVPLRFGSGWARIDYLGPPDYGWLNALLAEFARFEGRRWRELDQRLREPLGCPTSPLKLAAAVKVLRRSFRAERGDGFDAVRARQEVFDLAAREQRPRRGVLLEVARALNVEPSSLEERLFSDIPAERFVRAPERTPAAMELALRANSALAQSMLRGAAEVQVAVRENVRSVVRHARLRGLICTIRPGADASESRIAISGPFALFRHTLVYGRALGELVPLLARSSRFLLSARCRVRGEMVRFRMESGDPLFPAEEGRRYDSRLEERFARDLARRAPDWEVLREPEAVASRGTLIFPDFLLRHRLDPSRRWMVEILGFWTSDYVARKLDRLRAARIPNLILCIDEARRCSETDIPPHTPVVRFRKRIDVERVLELVEER